MLIFPRLLGVLVLIWGLRGIVETMVTGQMFWAATTLLWLLVGGYLVALRRIRLASLGVISLSVLELIVRVPNLTGLELLIWLALIVAVTEGRPHDRALLLRTCTTVVYGFTAVTKLNPSWLAGEGIAGLIVRQPQLSGLEFIAHSPLLSRSVAVLVVLTEGWLAVGLWHPRTRAMTALMGVLMHTAFVAVATPNSWATAHLIVLNFGLVCSYPAFWSGIRGPANPSPAPSERAIRYSS